MNATKVSNAVEIAEYIKTALEPHCEQIEIAGSIRRGKPDPGDIDIVLVWKGAGFGFMQFVRGNRGDISLPTGGARILKFNWLRPFVKVQLFQTNAGGWVSELLIRTGSKDHNIMMCAAAQKKGLILSVGHGLCYPTDCIDGKQPVEGIETERDIFNALGVRYAEPHERGK